MPKLSDASLDHEAGSPRPGPENEKEKEPVRMVGNVRTVSANTKKRKRMSFKRFAKSTMDFIILNNHLHNRLSEAAKETESASAAANGSTEPQLKEIQDFIFRHTTNDLGLSVVQIDSQGNRKAKAYFIMALLCSTIEKVFGTRAFPELVVRKEGGMNRIKEVNVCARDFRNPVPFNCKRNYVGCSYLEDIYLY